MDLRTSVMPSLRGLLRENSSPALERLASANPDDVSDSDLDVLVQHGFDLLTAPETHSALGTSHLIPQPTFSCVLTYPCVLWR